MRTKTYFILALSFCFFSCSSKPNNKTVEKEFQRLISENRLNEVFTISNIKRIDGIKEQDGSYSVDIEYDLTFLLNSKELLTSALPDFSKIFDDNADLKKINDKFDYLIIVCSFFGSSDYEGLITKVGNFEKGSEYKCKRKLTFEKSENGWRLINFIHNESTLIMQSGVATTTYYFEDLVLISIKVEEAREVLGQITTLEKVFFFSNNNYIEFEYGQDCDQIGYIDPNSSRFYYMFKKLKKYTGLAIAVERTDINGDGDTKDGLALDTENRKFIIKNGKLYLISMNSESKDSEAIKMYNVDIWQTSNLEINDIVW